jgi:hypothetical protein
MQDLKRRFRQALSSKAKASSALGWSSSDRLAGCYYYY